jgi:hypothetical protein
MSNLMRVRTYHNMYAEVNSDNPCFNFHTGRNLPFIEVFAICGDNREWREKFKVTSHELAESQIKEAIQFFNDTRRPDEQGIEKERKFICLYIEDEEVAWRTDNDGMSGWLDPEGIFHPCGFGEHTVYALNLINKEEEKNGWKNANTDEMEVLMENQHISMSVMEQSTGSFMSILGQLTPPQVEWFDRFFYKLAPTQRSTLSDKAKEQGIKLKYEW